MLKPEKSPERRCNSRGSHCLFSFTAVWCENLSHLSLARHTTNSSVFNFGGMSETATEVAPVIQTLLL